MSAVGDNWTDLWLLFFLGVGHVSCLRLACVLQRRARCFVRYCDDFVVRICPLYFDCLVLIDYFRYKGRKRLSATHDLETFSNALKSHVQLFKREKLVKYAFTDPGENSKRPNLVVTDEQYARLVETYKASSTYRQNQQTLENIRVSCSFCLVFSCS